MARLLLAIREWHWEGTIYPQLECQTACQKESKIKAMV